jgi:hypothetical protein
VLCEKPRSDDRREVAVYVELQDARESIGGSMRIFCDFGKSDFRPEYKGGLQWQLQDKDKNLVNATSYPFGGAVPVSEWVTLPTDATLRLRASPFGIHQAKAMAISPQLGAGMSIATSEPPWVGGGRDGIGASAGRPKCRTEGDGGPRTPISPPVRFARGLLPRTCSGGR